MTPNRRDHGFTLIELMITVAIIAILAAIAYPSYQSYVLKGNRASAQAFLMDAAQRQQQYFLDQRVYAPDVATLIGTIPKEVDPYYKITIATAAGPPATFTITAEPKGTQAASGSEPTLTIDQSGRRLPDTHW